VVRPTFGRLAAARQPASGRPGWYRAGHVGLLERAAQSDADVWPFGPLAFAAPCAQAVHLIWLAVSVVGLLVGGVAEFAIGRAAPQIGAAIRSAQAEAGVGPCPGGTLQPSAGAALASRLLPVPAGATHYTKGQWARRVVNVGQLAAELWQTNSRGRAMLTSRCFQTAAQVNWYEPGGAITVISLIQFATPNDARSFALTLEAADIADPRNSVHSALAGAPTGCSSASRRSITTATHCPG
jgi:hypothetical protein